MPLSRILERPIDPPLRARLRAAMISLLDAFGCSMLRHGLFQGDPHAGNLLLQVCEGVPPHPTTCAGEGQALRSPRMQLSSQSRAVCPLQDDGTLVLLDFGQCKALSAPRQRALARLVIALDRGWPSGVVAALKVCHAGCPLHAASVSSCSFVTSCDT